MALSPFDYVKSFSNKVCVWPEDDGKSYEPWVINKSLSFMQDCIFASNEMNKNWHLNKKEQHDFLFAFIPKGRRFGGWLKKEINPDVQIISEYFCIKTC